MFLWLELFFGAYCLVLVPFTSVKDFRFSFEKDIFFISEDLSPLNLHSFIKISLKWLNIIGSAVNETCRSASHE